MASKHARYTTGTAVPRVQFTFRRTVGVPVPYPETLSEVETCRIFAVEPCTNLFVGCINPESATSRAFARQLRNSSVVTAVEHGESFSFMCCARTAPSPSTLRPEE